VKANIPVLGHCDACWNAECPGLADVIADDDRPVAQGNILQLVECVHGSLDFPNRTEIAGRLFLQRRACAGQGGEIDPGGVRNESHLPQDHDCTPLRESSSRMSPS
jgi:hypothetical protein